MRTIPEIINDPKSVIPDTRLPFSLRQDFGEQALCLLLLHFGKTPEYGGPLPDKASKKMPAGP